jgi:hypothetical protein
MGGENISLCVNKFMLSGEEKVVCLDLREKAVGYLNYVRN